MEPEGFEAGGLSGLSAFRPERFQAEAFRPEGVQACGISSLRAFRPETNLKAFRPEDFQA